MLQVITEAEEVSLCQKQLHECLMTLLRGTGNYTIGYQGGNLNNEIYFNREVWFSFQIIKGNNPRYWNAFGTEELDKSGSNSIVVEINIPLSGINRRVSGIFAKDPTTKDIFLLHRGRVGGGKKGVGKDTFTKWYPGEQVEIDEGNGVINTAILVTALTAPSFLENLTFFIQKVANFKKSISTGDEEINLDKVAGIKVFSYKPEFSGVKRGKRSSSFIAECNHGRIVDALKEYLQKKYKSEIFNNQLIDLVAVEDNKVTAIYEIKTDTSKQNIYTGIGQLMFHAASDSSISKTLVLPQNITDDGQWVSVLRKLGISLLEYKIEGKKIQFIS